MDQVIAKVARWGVSTLSYILIIGIVFQPKKGRGSVSVGGFLFAHVHFLVWFPIGSCAPPILLAQAGSIARLAFSS